MFFLISILAAISGIGLAGVAAFQADTGIDHSIGAYLALLGTVGVTASLLIVWGGVGGAWMRGFFAFLAGFAAILTSVAAWFLMHDALVVAMVVSFLALVLSGVTRQRKKAY